jgi:hypothetical protein
MNKNPQVISVASIMFAALLATILFFIFLLVRYGADTVFNTLPPPRWSDLLFESAAFFFIIGFTDYPEMLRKYALLRHLVLCWGLWQLLLGLLWSAFSMSIITLATSFFISSTAMIAIYAAGLIYRAFGSKASPMT